MEMIITLSPQASNTNTNILVAGQVLTYNGTEYDLSIIPLNGESEGEDPAIGDIKNVDGVIHVTLIYPYDASLADPIQSTNLDDYIVDVTSGEVTSPIKIKVVEVQA
jgi:hypothetical protein